MMMLAPDDVARKAGPSVNPSSCVQKMVNVLGQQPRYLQLAQTLINEIQSGRFPVGSTIPTEFELCEQFGASRSTVREAVKQLVQLGMVVRQAGIGTTVKAVNSEGSYRQVMQQLSDLHRYSADTALQVLKKETVELSDASLCAMLQAKPGETWLRLEGIRRSPESVDPICHTEVYIQPAFRSLTGIEDDPHTPIFTMIERQFGEQIMRVQQEIRAVALPANIARLVNAKTRSPALWLSRRYFNKRGEIVEAAVSIHPADRFSYSETFQRGWSGA
ncbi:GntR family transcriptional regulator [Caballeronia hypogeia]|uniref:GntR family transcriptional regulator n=2 Tax=Caballeronia hypogeia TaxID=1777140 RepID=A0A158A6S5_9BURK|nr:GntR family transcriptional regulator [Caballeronia hypogeia]